jgi:mitogen-activated protein kinase kinase 3
MFFRTSFWNSQLFHLLFQILDDPSPTPPEGAFTPEFCFFINGCLQKDADARPTCEQVKGLDI